MSRIRARRSGWAAGCVLLSVSALGACGDETGGNDSPDGGGASGAGNLDGSGGESGGRSTGGESSGTGASSPEGGALPGSGGVTGSGREGSGGLGLGGLGGCPADDCREESPVFAIGSKQRTDTGWNSYLFLTQELDKDLSEGDAALTIEGGTLVHVLGIEGSSEVFVATNDSFVRRYRLQLDGGSVADAAEPLREDGDALDFGEVISGFGEYGAAFQFASPTKAFYLWGTTFIIWDPVEMSILESRGLYQGDWNLEREGYSPGISGAPLRVNDAIYWGVGWVGGPSNDEFLAESGFVIVDAMTDEIEIVTDDRCAYARDAVLGADGYIYLATGAYAVASYNVDASKSPAPCMVRFDPDVGAFDQDFLVEGVTPETAAGKVVEEPEALLLSGPLLQAADGSTFVKFLDPALAENAPHADYLLRLVASVDDIYHWARVELGEEPTFTLLKQPPSTGSMLPFALGDRVFTASYYRDPESLSPFPSRTEFIELRDEGPGEVAFRVPGQSFSFVRLK